MRVLKKFMSLCTLLLCVLWLAVFAGCASDPNSELQQDQTTPPILATSPATYNITVESNLPRIQLGSADSAIITIRVARLDNGQPPPNGATVVVTASVGVFNSQDGQNPEIVILNNGRADLSYFLTSVGPEVIIIQARLEDSIGQTQIEVLDPEAFFVSAVRPSFGSPNDGDSVVISGGGFNPPIRVTFGTTPAQVLSLTPIRIMVLTPPSLEYTLPVDVSVTVNLNTVDQKVGTLRGGFVYSHYPSVEQPAIISLGPTSGPKESWTQVTLFGKGFEAPAQVFFGSVEAEIQSVTPTQIIAVAPPATGINSDNRSRTVDVLVRNSNSGLSAVLITGFIYTDHMLITSVEPNIIQYGSATNIITISGQGFDAPVAVDLAGVDAQVLSVTGSEIVARANSPEVDNCQDFSGPVTVTNIETGETAISSDFVVHVSQPALFTVNPNRSAGDTQPEVTLQVQNVLEPVSVQFGEVEATVLSVSRDIIEVRPPLFFAFDEEVCDDDGDGGQQGLRFVPTAVDVTITKLGTGCSTRFINGFTYVPADMSCRGDAIF